MTIYEFLKHMGCLPLRQISTMGPYHSNLAQETKMGVESHPQQDEPCEQDVEHFLVYIP